MKTRLSLLPGTLLLLWLAVSLAQTGSQIVNSYNNFPELDYLDLVAHLDGYRQFPPAVLWEQHYEHRIIFPELVFALDWCFLKGREVLPLVLMAVLDIGIWLLLAVSLAQSRNSGARAHIGRVEWCGLFLAGIVMFWPGVALVLAFPFSLQFVLSQFALAAALWAFSRNRMGWAIAFAVVTSFSSANGLMAWPLLLLFGRVNGTGFRNAALIAPGGAVSLLLFFAGYRNRGVWHPGTMFSQPVKFFGYLLSYLGTPFSILGTEAGLAAGAFSIILFGLLIFLAKRQGVAAKPASVLGFGIILYTLATGFVTSCSRIPFDRPFDSAIVIPYRYTNFAVQYWGVLIFLTVWLTARVHRKYAWSFVAVMTLVLAAVLPKTQHWLTDWMGNYKGYQVATLAIESGLTGESLVRGLNYPDAKLVQRSVAALKQRHLALFSRDDYKLVGANIESQRKRMAVLLPAGQVEYARPVEGGWVIVGWAKPHAQPLVVVDRSGTIVGLGRHLRAGIPIGIAPPLGHAEDFWVAFAGATFDQQTARYFPMR